MSGKKILIITCVFIGLVVVGGGALIYYLQFHVIRDTDARLTKLKQDFQTLHKKQQDIGRLEEEFKQLDDRLANVYSRIPMLEGGTWDRHFKHLELIKRESGIFYSSYMPGKPAAGTGPAGAAAGATGAGAAKAEDAYWDLTVRGGLRELGAFLTMLEQEDLIVIIDNFNIRGGRTSSAGGIPLKELKILVKTYGFKPEPPAPAKTPPGPAKPTAAK
jgi:Tfp pilus assembly protein PilO